MTITRSRIKTSITHRLTKHLIYPNILIVGLISQSILISQSSHADELAIDATEHSTQTELQTTALDDSAPTDNSTDIDEEESPITYSSRTPYDPWEGYNRAMFKFNEVVVDRFILRPLAETYRTVTPVPIRKAVQNFFSNLKEVVTIPNDLLQGKFAQARDDSARFLINTTLGMGGIFDFATELGLDEHDEDFGQTFGYWGIPQGPYFVLPLLGPSTVRDTIGLIPDKLIEPTQHISEDSVSLLLTGVEVVAKRAEFIDGEGIIKGDKYVFVREAYIQRREYLTNDGVVDEDPFLDDEW